MDTVSPVYEKIKEAVSLPSPNGVALAIFRISKDPRAKIDDITSIVEMDPATAARIIKYVNSPLAGVARKVASLQRAIILLGTRTVVNISLSQSLMAQYRSGECRGFDYSRFWSESVARAATARHLASHLKSVDPNEAFTCGLLSKIGQLALATGFPDAYARLLAKIDLADVKRLCEYERQIFKIDHNQLTAEMMNDWQLPEVFADAVNYQDDPEHADLEPGITDQLAHMLAIGQLIAPIFNNRSVGHEKLQELLAAVHLINIQPDGFAQTFNNITLEWHEMGKIFAVQTHEVNDWEALYGAHA